MAKSRFEYVKKFEEATNFSILPDAWIVIRIDGKGFSEFTNLNDFEKPNDKWGLYLMAVAAQWVMTQFPDIRIAYGHSDEFSFVFHKSATIYGRRLCKLVSLVVSAFSSCYVAQWPHIMPEPMKGIPFFDGRAVAYPSETSLKDYLSWRQADCHINNQYNMCFWVLVHSGCEKQEAYSRLQGTCTADKNNLLFEHQINYNECPEMFKKGNILVRKKLDPEKDLEETNREATEEFAHLCVKSSKSIHLLHVDLIHPSFWNRHPYILQK
eukprot:Platyproteum_vivax@DN17420_c0_g1_i1.p1